MECHSKKEFRSFLWAVAGSLVLAGCAPSMPEEVAVKPFPSLGRVPSRPIIMEHEERQGLFENLLEDQQRGQALSRSVTEDPQRPAQGR